MAPPEPSAQTPPHAVPVTPTATPIGGWTTEEGPPPVGEGPPPNVAASPGAAESPLDSLLRTLKWGNIAFNTPSSIGYGQTLVIHLILDPTKSIAQLQSSIQEEGAKQGAHVQVAPRMEAHLTGDGFEITPVTPEDQAVSMQGATEWKWDIRPKEFGTQSLHLSLNALLKIDGENTTRSIQTFDRPISIDVSWPATIIAYPQDHWEIFTATGGAIIGVFLWAFRLKGKNNRPKE